MDFIGFFELKNLEELNTQRFTFENKNFEFLVKSPNCDCRDYRIVSDLFVYELITKNGQKAIDIFMRRNDKMNFSNLDLSYMPLDGFCIVKNNELKFEGFWTVLIEKEIAAINEWARLAVEERNRLRELNLQSILKVYDNYYKNIV